SLAITENSLGKNHTEYFGRLVRLATCFYEQQQYSRAQETLDDAKRLQGTIFKDLPHPYIARMLQLQSEVLRRRGRFADAREVIEQAIEMKKVLYGTEEHPSVAEALEVKVKILHHLGEKVEAKRLIDRTLEIRRKAYGMNHPDVSRSIHDLGSYYLRLGQYKEAIEQFEQARQITAKVFGSKHPDYVERTLNLANARNEQGEYRQALELMDQVKDVEPAWNRLLAARRLQLMGELQRRMGRFGAAMEYINQAIELKMVIYGTENHPSVAEALAVQAKIYDHLCEFDKEQTVWERVLDIQGRFYSEQHPALAATHYDYASLFLRKGEYARALEHLTESLAITENSLGKNHTEYFGRLVRLATCLYEQQKYSQVLDTLKEAESLQNAIFAGSAHPYIARMLQLQSEVLQRLARFDDAREVIEQAIEMKKVLYGTEEHPSVDEALEVKVDLLLSQYRLKETVQILDAIERIRRRAYDANHPQYANYQLRRARWYEIEGRYDEARDILEQSLQTCLKAFSSDHPETIKRQIMSARLARMTNNIVLAETRINRVRDTLGSSLETEDSQIVAEMCQERSNIRRAEGDYQDALAELENALRTETRIFGPESPAVIELQNEKAKLLILFHRLPEAEDIIKSALGYVKLDQPIFKRLRSDLLGHRGILHDHKREYDRAIESLEEAIKLKKELLGDDNVELARLYIERAVILRHLGKHTEALASLDAAQSIDNRHFKAEDHIYYARILLEQGQTCLEQSNDLAAQAYLKESLQIYAAQPNRNVKQHADAAEALGQSYLETGFLHEASEMFQKAMEIRTTIYGSSHPEIAETLYNQAQILLKMAKTAENQDAKAKARQKLEQAQIMLGQRDDDNAELRSEIEHTLANL
ncbi:MAG: tetratricopeptide repeat protein, partial [Anaerolineales bacterium]